jgi:hypothetical protein
MEYALYADALAQFDDQAFADAGFASWVRRRFEDILDHEAAHVITLNESLGSATVLPCNYTL